MVLVGLFNATNSGEHLSHNRFFLIAFWLVQKSL